VCLDIGDRRHGDVKGKGSWVKAHEGVKRGLRSCGVSLDVMGKFGSREMRSPVILLDGSVNMEVLFKFLINSFCLTIGLRMIGHR